MSSPSAVSGRDHRGLDGDRRTPGDRPAPEGPQCNEGRRGAELLASRGSRAQATAEHGGEEDRRSAVAGSRSGCAAAEPGVRYARKKGRNGRTSWSPMEEKAPAHDAEIRTMTTCRDQAPPRITSRPLAAVIRTASLTTLLLGDQLIGASRWAAWHGWEVSLFSVVPYHHVAIAAESGGGECRPPSSTARCGVRPCRRDVPPRWRAA